MMVDSPLRRHARNFISQSVRILPSPLFNTLLSRAANQTLGEQIRQGELDFLQGHYWEITLTDVPLTFYLTLDCGQLQVSQTPQTATVAFQGPLKSFMVLTLQWDDPDTLFFNRQLSVSGDTEMGLQIKNFMHSIEAKEVLPVPVYQLISRTYEQLYSV